MDEINVSQELISLSNDLGVILSVSIAAPNFQYSFDHKHYTIYDLTAALSTYLLFVEDYEKLRIST